MSYLETTAAFYGDVAENPSVGLCCVGGAPLRLPELSVPERMAAMNYGCGQTVHPGELGDAPTVLYVGVGGGLEALQFAYFSRRPGGVIAVDPVERMREAARVNLRDAAGVNAWFDSAFVDIRAGDAFALPAGDASVDVVAQNCLFNIFEPDDLSRALAETHRVLRPRGRLVMSDPIAPFPLPQALRDDERLRAMCLSGASTYDAYVERIVAAGFGEIHVRARRPYRALDTHAYRLAEPIVLESLDLVAHAVPIPSDGACVFTGRTAIYVGEDDRLHDGHGHHMARGVPLDVCDKTALQLADRPDVVVTAPTWHYTGGACC